jgi:O-antigen/teichoic acid export membrane protein
MTVTVGAAFAGLAILGHWALPFAFGAGFVGAFGPLMVLGVNQWLAAMSGPGIMLLSMTGHERTVARAYITSVLMAVAAAIVLTPLFGVTGTAASMIVATVVRAVMLNSKSREALGLEPSLLGALKIVGHLRRHSTIGVKL